MSCNRTRTSMKPPTSSSKKIKSLCKKKRIEPYCVACRISFKNVVQFEQHLQTDEHKVIDSPLEYILELEESRLFNRDEEHKNSSPQTAEGEPGLTRRSHTSLDISGGAIGAECVSRVEVPFCNVCKTFISGEDPEAVARHCMSVQHVKKLS